MLVIYDNNGKVWHMSNSTEVPTGLPYMNIVTPSGFYLESVDVSHEPHVPVFKKYPKSELELMKEANEKQQADIDYLMLLNETSL